MEYLDNMQYSQEDTKNICESNTLTLLLSPTKDLNGSTQRANMCVGSLNKTLLPGALAVWRMLKITYRTAETAQHVKILLPSALD